MAYNKVEGLNNQNINGKKEKCIRVRNVPTTMQNELENICTRVGKSAGEIVKDHLPLIIRQFPAHYAAKPLPE